MFSKEHSLIIEKNFIFSAAQKENIDKYIADDSICVRSFQSGDVIYSADSPSMYVGIILCGSAVVEPVNSNEKTLLTVLLENDMFGVANLYCDDKPFPSIIIAKNASKVLFIDGDAFKLLVEKDSGALRAYLRFMSGKIVFLNKKISTLTAGCAEKKLAVFLAEHERDGVFNKSISMSALAEILNIGRASLYRSLDDLEAQGYITRQGKTIIISDKNALLNLI